MVIQLPAEYLDLYRIALQWTSDKDHATKLVERWLQGRLQADEQTAVCGCPGTTCRYQ